MAYRARKTTRRAPARRAAPRSTRRTSTSKRRSPAAQTIRIVLQTGDQTPVGNPFQKVEPTVKKGRF